MSIFANLDRRHLALPVSVSLTIGVFLPLGLLVVFSFFDVEDFELVPTASLRAWSDLFSTSLYTLLIGKAILSGAGTALATAVIGYPIALSIRRLRPSLKSLAVIVLLTPLYTGEIVRIYAWRLVLGSEGLVNALLRMLGAIHAPLAFLLFSPFSTVLVLIYNNLPFMVLSIWVSAEMIDQRLIEAARDLGARPSEAFSRVVLPLTMPGLAAGCFAVFALAAGEMEVPSLIGGTSGGTAMSMVEGLFGTAYDWPLASALSLSLLISLFLCAGFSAFLLTRFRGAQTVLAGISSR